MAAVARYLPLFRGITGHFCRRFASDLCVSNSYSAPTKATSYFSDVQTSRPVALGILVPISYVRNSNTMRSVSADQQIDSCGRFLCTQNGFCLLVKVRVTPEGRGRRSSIICRSDASEEETGFTDSKPVSEVGLNRLDLLERITGNSSRGNDRDSIRWQLEQLAEKYDLEGREVTIPLGASKKTPFRPLTISQKRNIRRQEYLDEVAQRNDAPFFAAVGALILLPPVIILGVAVASGYVNIFP